jgi:hypothetical protein
MRLGFARVRQSRNRKSEYFPQRRQGAKVGYAEVDSFEECNFFSELGVFARSTLLRVVSLSNHALAG